MFIIPDICPDIVRLRTINVIKRTQLIRFLLRFIPQNITNQLIMIVAYFSL